MKKKKVAALDYKLKSIIDYTPEGYSPRLYFQLVKRQVLGTDKQGKERPDEDVFYFLYVSKRTGLDPLVKQIYPVYRWNYRTGKEEMTIQVGIDGMRLVAQRSKLYGGQDDVKFIPENEKAPHPTKATCTVYKINPINGNKLPVTASARWDEYIQLDKKAKPMGLWGKMPYNQLGKCAEALALRKAFPNELSGIYADEEMQQANNELKDLPKPKIDKLHKIDTKSGRVVAKDIIKKRKKLKKS